MSKDTPSLTDFSARVRARDHGACVVCGGAAQETRLLYAADLWADGGLHLDNAASLCAEHARALEETVLLPEALRVAAKIARRCAPDHFEADQRYDHWGNPVLPNGQRMRGELFFTPRVQAALTKGGALERFSNRFKYPRTPHAPWSPGATSDDSRLASFAPFLGKRVIVTVKMDGENATLYRDYYHARSIDGRHHPSRDWLKGFWAALCEGIPEDWRLCGENLYARHSIAYDALPSLFLGFSIWNEENVCLSWDETREWFALLGVTPVTVLYDGVFDAAKIEALSLPEGEEGVVTRLAEPFPYARFRHSVFKVVRKHHVTTDQHWMHGPIVRNRLAGDARP